MHDGTVPGEGVALTNSSSHFRRSALVYLSTSVSTKEKRLRAYRLEAEAARRPATLVKPTILMPLTIGDFAGLGALDIAAAFDGQVDHHRARFHRLHHVGGDKARRRPARDQRRGDDDVLLLDVLGHQCGLFGLILFDISLA